METTNERDFCRRPAAERQPLIEKKSRLRSNIQLEGEHSFTTTHREDFHVEDFQPSALRQKTPAWEKRGATKDIQLATLYQRDFLPPQRTHRKSTPALPLPDNLGINPSLRWEFLTVQKETYPWWTTGRALSPQQEHTLSHVTPPSGGNKVLRVTTAFCFLCTTVGTSGSTYLPVFLDIIFCLILFVLFFQVLTPMSEMSEAQAENSPHTVLSTTHTDMKMRKSDQL
ncbi:hypothetical protein ACEWY4_009842 [Coilia grayii]|uniref:Uncharacterized protein n=1 Tax=Coilia grayii TaxID=363190 RepID=A0ABD1K7K1_9TELE